MSDLNQKINMSKATEKTLEEYKVKLDNFIYAPYKQEIVKLDEKREIQVYRQVLPEGFKWMENRWILDADEKCGFCGHRIENTVMLISPSAKIGTIVGYDCASKVLGDNKELIILYKQKVTKLKTLLKSFYDTLLRLDPKFDTFVKQKRSKKQLIAKIPSEYDVCWSGVGKKLTLDYGTKDYSSDLERRREFYYKWEPDAIEYSKKKNFNHTDFLKFLTKSINEIKNIQVQIEIVAKELRKYPGVSLAKLEDS